MIKHLKILLLVATTYLSSYCSLHAYQLHNTTALLLLLQAEIEKEAQGNLKDILQKIKEHKEIDTETLKDIYQWLDLRPEDFNDETPPVKIILQKIKAKKNVIFSTEGASYHSLIPKKISSSIITASDYYLTLTPKDNQQSVQKSIDYLVDTEPESSFAYVDLRQILTENQHIPPHLLDKLLNKVQEILTLTQQRRTLRKKRRKQRSQEDKKKINRIKRELQKRFVELYIISRECNLDPGEVEELVSNHDEVQLDTTTQTPCTAVDTLSQDTVTPYGANLLIHIPRPSTQEENPYTNTTHTAPQDPYANEEINFKDYQAQQKHIYSLSRYLKVTTDPDTGQKIYIVYYQIYDKDKRKFRYRKYTPQGIKKIKERTFFKQSQNEEVHFIAYQKVDTLPLFYRMPWVHSHTLEQLQSIGTGAIIAFILIAIMQRNDKPKIIYRDRFMDTRSNNSTEQHYNYNPSERRQQTSQERLKDGGLYNIGYSCYWNALMQIIRELYSNLFKDQNYGEEDPRNIIIPDDLKGPYNTLFASMKRGSEGKEGVSRDEIYVARDAVHKYGHWYGSHGPQNLKQEDPDELLKALKRAIEATNEAKVTKKEKEEKDDEYGIKLEAEAIPYNFLQEEGKVFDYGIKYNDINITKTDKQTKKLGSMLSVGYLEDNTTLKQLIERYADGEKLEGENRPFKIWREFCEDIEKQAKVKIEDKNIPKQVINYCILKDYERTCKKIKEKKINKKLGSESKNILQKNLENWLQKFQNNDQNSLDKNRIKTSCNNIITSFGGAKVEDVPALIINGVDEIEDETKNAIEYLLFNTVKEWMAKKKVFNIRSDIENAQKLYRAIKTKKLLDKDSKPRKASDEDKKKVVEFFTGKGLDKASIENKLDQNDIRTYFIDKDNISIKFICNTKKTLTPKLLTKSKTKTVAIQLKRFDSNRKKNNAKITNCMELTLPAKFVNENFAVKLELCAAQIHSGTREFGHYTACIKKNGKWKYYNDTFVSDKEEKDIEKFIQGDSSKAENAYLLFYKYKKVEEDHAEAQE